MSRALREKFPKINEKTFDRIFEWDPSRSNKYALWIAKRVMDNEKLEKVLDLVQEFHTQVSRLEKKDLYAYKSAGDLRKTLKQLGKSKSSLRKKDPGYSLVRETEGAAVYLLESYQGALTLGRDTKWCITTKATWDHTYADKVLLVVVNKKKENRAPFSKFAVEFGDVVAFENTDLLTYDAMKYSLWRLQCGDSRSDDLFLDNVSIYDERNRGGRDGGRGNAHWEILDYVMGPGVFAEILTEVVREKFGSFEEDKLLQVLTMLEKGKDLSREGFEEAIEMVISSKLFNVLSLFAHPKARLVGCRKHLWEVVQDLSMDKPKKGAKEPVLSDKNVSFSRNELKFLVETPAMGIPRVMELYMEGVGGAAAGRRLVRKKDTQEWLTPVLRNRNLTEESKKIALEVIARDILKMEGHGEPRKIPAFPKKRKAS